MQRAEMGMAVGETEGGKNFRDLIAWQKAMDLVVLVYSLTQSLPSEEKFGLTSQLRRCAVSVPSNIAEGQGRNGDGEFVRFLNIAHGSIREVETQLEICCRLNFIDRQAAIPAFTLAAEIGRLINGLIRSKRQ